MNNLVKVPMHGLVHVKIKVSGYSRWRCRMWIGCRLLRLTQWITGWQIDAEIN